MNDATATTRVAVIGGGVVGTAVLHALAHRGVDAVLIEACDELALAASGTNSGILHTGFDSTAGELETALILRAAELRPAVLAALDVPVLPVGARLQPRAEGDDAVIAALAENAERNGVDVEIRTTDGALLVPGESVTDPVAFSSALAASAVAAGGSVLLDSAVIGIDRRTDGLRVVLRGGRTIDAEVVVNAAGLHADDIAAMVGDTSFEIFPRKGEFFVFELPGASRLDQILLPVPTKRTKGVLVFPTVDGRVIAGPTACDLVDKGDWSVRSEAAAEILPKAIAQFAELEGLEPVFSYAGLRPAGRGSNYVIGSSSAEPRLINVAAIRSTGLTASLGIADHVAGLLPALGVEPGEPRPTVEAGAPRTATPWWQRTAGRLAARA